MSLVSERILSETRLLSTVDRCILGFYFVDEDIQNSVTVKTKNATQFVLQPFEISHELLLSLVHKNPFVSLVSRSWLLIYQEQS